MKTRLEIEVEQSLRQALALGRQMTAITDALFSGGKLASNPEPLCVCGHDDSFHGGRGCVADECDCQDFRLPVARVKPNPERLQKRCEACCGTGRLDSGDDVYQRCDMCGGEGMLP